MAPRPVLIVENDDDIRSGLEELFIEDGFEVACAQGGDEALRALDAFDRTPVIVLDLMMSPMSGEAFLEALRKRGDYGAQRVIVVSASGAGLNSSHPAVVASFRKPFDLQALLECARKAGVDPSSS